MRILEKNYRYLLLNLIPQHRLGIRRRRHLEQAADSGNLAEMRRVAVSALEDLCEAGHFRRSDTEVGGDHVLVTYARNKGHYQIRLEVPLEQWRTLGGATEEVVTPQKDPSPAPKAVDTTFAILPDIIRSLSINDRHISTFERLESVMRLLPRWLDVASMKLLLSEERFGKHENSQSLVTTLPERAITARAIYERCRRSGEVELLGMEAAHALGIAEIDAKTGNGNDRHVAVAPIFSSGEFWGILDVWFVAATAPQNMWWRIEIAVGMVEQIIENNQRLENLTSIDKLTGVYNRNYYEAQVQIEIERATRSKSKLSMLILDIDDFKKINDTHGHRKGDEALSTVADLIKKNLRKIDLPFRYGGEEFVILLPGTTEVEAIHTAERLRAVIAGTRLDDSHGGQIPIHASIGAAVFPDHAGSEEELFAKADSALYRAKRMGKDRVEFHRGT